MNAPAVSVEVFQRFHALRRRHLLVRLGIAFTVAAVALLATWVASAATDYYWELPLAWRRGGAAVAIALVTLWLTHRLFRIVRETRQRRFAGRLEGSFVEFGQRIRTVLDTVEGRVSGPTAMLTALGHQTLGRWETSTPSRIVPSRTLLVSGVTCLLGIGFAASLFHATQDWQAAMRRALGDDVAYTSLTVTPGDATVLEGSPVEVSLVLHGRTNREVHLRYRQLGDGDANEGSSDAAEIEWIESELLPVEPSDGEPLNPRSARFVSGLGKAMFPIEYQFVTSVGTTSRFRVGVRPLIEARHIAATVEPPQYTKLETRSFVSTDVTVLEQSAVNVTVETNHPLGEATLKIGPKPSQLKSVEIVAGDDPTRWTFELPSTESLSWVFSGAGLDGTPMAPVKGRLRIRRDAAPNLDWRDPPDEIRVHTLAELPMRLQVSDDYGISETAIVFQLGGDDEYVLTDWLSDQGTNESDTTTTRVRLEELLPLESFSLSERDYISYYAYAVDNRAPTARRSETDVRYIDIRPLRQYFSEIERDPNARSGDGNVLVQLDEIIRRQRFLINRTRKLVRGSAGDLANQLRVIDRMVESQSELAGLARFLAEFFVSRGNDDVEALNQAEAAMLQAADSLAAARFDLALAQEEDALRALAEARRTIEIALIKNPSLQQREAMRQLSRQLRQKLRRDRPESEQEVADTLMQIAAQQSQLGEVASRLASGPSSDAELAAGGTSAEDGEQAEQTEKDELDDPAESDAASLEEQRDQLFSGQVDLIERLQAIEEQLEPRLTDSELMTRRMESAKAAMNRLATAAREGEVGEFSSQSRDASEQLRELGIQLEAVAATEPVTRVSAIRDMTTSLANMESELADRLQAAGSDPRASRDNPPSPRDDPQRPGDGVERLARRMQRRAETVDDVLKAPVEIGDVETGEVVDRLQAFAQENGLFEQLESTREAAERLSTEAPGATDGASQGATEGASQGATEGASQQAYARAVEYADTAHQLDDLYRQMVTPRLERLREIEARANNLARQLGNGGKPEEDPSDPETKAGIGKLQQDLKDEGLDELAELLDADAYPDGPSGSVGLPGPDATDDRFSPTNRLGLTGRTLLVVEELRERIQEMILLEISADRDAPVPPQYRTAVDQYLRVIAGESEGIGSDEVSQELTDAPASTDGGASR